jgi:hypothetical protein
MTGHKTYFFGFDYLRAIFCIVVVAWHNSIIGETTRTYSPGISRISPTIPDIIYFNFFLLAVPVFYQIALILYISNRQERGSEYFFRRMARLLPLFFFWSGLMLIFQYFVSGINIKPYFATYNAAISTLVSGGRSLFYYFFPLIVLTPFTELLLCSLRMQQVKKAFIAISFVASLVLLIASPDLLGKIDHNYWISVEFLPYVFSAFILVDYLKASSRRTWTASVLFSLFIIFSVLEWTVVRHHLWSGYWFYIIPPYNRISLVFGAMFMVVVFGKTEKPPPRIIFLLSNCSLGIYCFHSFIPTSQMWKFFNIHPHPLGIVNCLIQLSGALILTLLCRKIPLMRRFV